MNEKLPLLGFLGGGDWLFDHLQELGIKGIAFGEGVASRSNGNVVPIEIPLKSATAMEEIWDVSANLPIKRYVTLTEAGTEIAAALNDRSKLGGVSPFTARAAKQKSVMRKLLEGTDIETKFLSVYSKDVNEPELRRRLRSFSFPVVVKPAAGVASIGVKIVNNSDELISAVREISGEIIIEEFIQGDEFSVETFSLNGEYVVAAITKKHNDGAVEIGFGVCNALTEELESKVRPALDVLFDRLDLRSGPAHTELKIDSNGSVRVIETHARVCGYHIPELVRHVTGIDLYKLTVREAANQLDTLPSRGCFGVSAYLEFKKVPPGTVMRISGTNQMMMRRGLIGWDCSTKAGEVVQASGDNRSRKDWVAASSSDLESAKTICAAALSELKIYVQP